MEQLPSSEQPMFRDSIKLMREIHAERDERPMDYVGILEYRFGKLELTKSMIDIIKTIGLFDESRIYTDDGIKFGILVGLQTANKLLSIQQFYKMADQLNIMIADTETTATKLSPENYIYSWMNSLLGHSIEAQNQMDDLMPILVNDRNMALSNFSDKSVMEDSYGLVLSVVDNVLKNEEEQLRDLNIKVQS